MCRLAGHVVQHGTAVCNALCIAFTEANTSVHAVLMHSHIAAAGGCSLAKSHLDVDIISSQLLNACP